MMVRESTESARAISTIYCCPGQKFFNALSLDPDLFVEDRSSRARTCRASSAEVDACRSVFQLRP